MGGFVNGSVIKEGSITGDKLNKDSVISFISKVLKHDSIRQVIKDIILNIEKEKGNEQ